MTDDDIEFSQYKIAIVDSDNLFCQQLQACLRDAGFQVEYERNAPAGFKRIKNWKPHILVSDYILSGMDYFDFAAKIEAMPTKTCMIVVSSHYLDGQLIAQLTNLSRVKLTVQKPIKSEDLLQKIIDFLPEIDVIQENEPPELEDEESDYSLNDADLQQEVARLQFEGKELPRLVNSLKALTDLAREQPHKGKYLREAQEQSKRSLYEVRRQRLPHLEAPFERIINWFNDIIEQGSLPSLQLWDYVQDELETLSEPRKHVGTSTLSTVEVEDYSYAPGIQDQFQDQLPAAPWQAQRTPERPRKSPAAHQRGRVQKFLIIGDDPSEELLNLGSRYGASITFKESIEQAHEACLSGFFDLILLLLPSTVSGERARESVVATHEMMRGIDSYKETPLVVLSATESLHTRIVTAHLNNSHWMSWSEIRKSGAGEEFLTLKTLGAQPIMRPEVLIIDSDISDSEDLLRELSRSCSRVDAVRDPDAVIKVIEENKPDMILISERTGDLSGFDLCRAIRSCLSFKSITLILEVNTINDSSLKGAFRAGADGVICKTESVESRAESMLTICQRSFMSRLFSEEAGEKSLEVTAAIREALEKDLKKAIEEQSPLSVCLIDLGDEGTTSDDFAHLWKSKQKELTTPNTGAVHFLSATQILVSIVGLRKSTVEKVLEEMIETDPLRVDDTARQWRFRCRCYPDDALSLSELLRFF